MYVQSWRLFNQPCSSHSSVNKAWSWALWELTWNGTFGGKLSRMMLSAGYFVILDWDPRRDPRPAHTNSTGIWRWPGAGKYPLPGSLLLGWTWHRGDGLRGLSLGGWEGGQVGQEPDSFSLGQASHLQATGEKQRAGGSSHPTSGNRCLTRIHVLA